MPEIDLLALLQGRLNVIEDTRDDVMISGVTLGEVTDLDDPVGLGRIKVKMHWLSEQVESAWARLAVPWSGMMMGSYFLPEVGDECVIACRHGDPTNPYIIGFLWSPTVLPPELTPRLARRLLKSKSGHKVQFDDLPGVGKVSIASGLGHSIVLDDTAGASKISISDPTGTLSITIDAVSRAINIESIGDIKLTAPTGSITLLGDSIDIVATGDMTLAGDSVTVVGDPVAIN